MPRYDGDNPTCLLGHGRACQTVYPIPPLRENVAVNRVSPRAEGGYRVETTAGNWHADQVVVATGDYQGRIYPINPRSESIGDLKCYADARALPEAPDLGLVLVGANRVIDSVRELAEAGTKVAIVLASGFGEAGEHGQHLQAELRAAGGSMRILGPNTIGLVNLSDGIMLTARGAMEMKEFRAGGIALLSQSGGIL